MTMSNVFTSLLAISLSKSLAFSLNHRIHTLLMTFSAFFQLLKVCALDWEFCSAQTLRQDVY